MAVLTVDIPDELITKIEGTGRPAEQVVTEALERELSNGALSAEAVTAEPSREEMIQQWIDSGLIADPNEWKTLDTESWDSLSEAEKQQHLRALNEVHFPNSEISRFIHENRR